MRSRRMQFDSAANLLSAAVAKARAAELPLIDLTHSNPTTAGLPRVSGLITPLGEARGCAYEPAPFGVTSARAAVAAHLETRGLVVDADRIVLTASTSEAYAWLFTLLCDPGDSVAVPAPSYPLLDHIARLVGVETRPYRLEWEGRWRVDPDSLATAVGPGCRAIVTVNPNNPTGQMISAADLAVLAAPGLPLIGDEVFADCPLETHTDAVASVLACLEVPVFALGGLSKSAGLPQLKLAWIAAGGPEAVVNDLLEGLEWIADTFLSVATPVQLALPHLIAASASTRLSIRARCCDNLAFLRERTADSAISVPRVEGGWSACLRLPRLQSDEAWALELVERDGVIVHPGWFYDFAGEGWLVVSLIAEPSGFREGVERLVARVATRAAG